MSNIWTLMICGVALAGATLINAPQDVQARPLYLKGFNTAYPALINAADSAKCTICHFGDTKRNRNDYGKAVGQGLGGARDVKGAKAIEDALKKAEGGNSSVEGKTFGDLINEGKLPGKNP